jgi:hypothetical protein
VRRLRDEERTLRDEVRRSQEGEPNLPVVEVLPDSSVPRSSARPVTRVVVPPSARLVVLVLGLEKARLGAASVELRRADGQVLWRGDGLQPGPLGGYTLGLPASLLAAGRYSLAVRAAGGADETYTIHVERVTPDR